MERKCPVIFLEDSKGIIKLKDKTGNIFILSDEEIKEGDWFYYQRVGALNEPILAKKTNEKYWKENAAKKIIATIDRNLILCRDSNHEEKCTCNKLPQPSQSFLELYVKEYNAGRQIKEVLVDYEPKESWLYTYDVDGNRICEKLKINKDNTINIKSVKDSWSREEVKELTSKAFHSGAIENLAVYNFDKWWIEQNL